MSYLDPCRTSRIYTLHFGQHPAMQACPRLTGLVPMSRTTPMHCGDVATAIPVVASPASSGTEAWG
jgi:hypothetical protein